mgnify:CR=1 FL=1
MIHVPKFEFYPYWELVKRRKWWIIVPFLLVALSGSAYMYTAPKIYKASTLILVEAQRVPESYVKPTISQSLESRLHTITQQINSRSYLENVIKRYDLYLGSNSGYENGIMASLGDVLEKLPFISEGKASQQNDGSESSLYSKVQTLRKRINVNLRGKDNRAFEIAFQWYDPEVAARVSNAIASQFIEQNLKVREEMAMGTTSFLSMEVQQLRNQLEKKEQELENFREKNMGKLPEQLESNLNILNQLKEEQNNLEKRIDMEKQQAMMLRKQLRSGSGSQMAQSGEGGSEENEIAALKNTLDAMKSKYTEKHPDVVALKKRLREKLQARSEEGADVKAEEGAVEEYVSQSKNSLQRQLAKTRARIDRYEEQIAEVKERIEKYQQRVEQTPKVEMKLKDLQRDYQTVQKRYEDLLAKKLDAQMAEELEKRQKGEQFRVIDSAIPPETPFKPDMRKLGLLTFVLALGLGGGLSYLRESLDPAFYTAEDAENHLGRKVLVTLPWEGSKE